ncbi:MAG: enoyl-CoA hydratase/isomerase family protein [Phreatobacter sp.]|uniref:enoyl-CoA hydratase/isomerase family protein n=1 Tax=Phreatobacter sp. TaxID=1966341 RepID=UPI002735C359|nr:enoyl-CoA hydratase/isomerase family protein [Phreatobacter sp.]MDP2800551.1 enoyl-CoA hydratase/isomerase family protein [Phreatobacter sp.]
MPALINITREGPTAILTFDRPDALNAWNAEMRAEIVAKLATLDADPDVRVVIVTGAGLRAFGAGQDRDEPAPADAEIEAWVAGWGRFFGAFRALSKPTIAALNGVAAGSAFQVALLCDFRIGHAGVRMGQPEIRAGIASSSGPWIISSALGLAVATDLCLTGRMMEAAECRRLGLFNREAEPDQVVAEALRLAADLAGLSPLALALTRRRLKQFDEADFAETLALWPGMFRQIRDRQT